MNYFSFIQFYTCKSLSNQSFTKMMRTSSQIAVVKKICSSHLEQDEWNHFFQTKDSELLQVPKWLLPLIHSNFKSDDLDEIVGESSEKNYLILFISSPTLQCYVFPSQKQRLFSVYRSSWILSCAKNTIMTSTLDLQWN